MRSKEDQMLSDRMPAIDDWCRGASAGNGAGKNRLR